MRCAAIRWEVDAAIASEYTKESAPTSFVRSHGGGPHPTHPYSPRIIRFPKPKLDTAGKSRFRTVALSGEECKVLLDYFLERKKHRSDGEVAEIGATDGPALTIGPDCPLLKKPLMGSGHFDSGKVRMDVFVQQGWTLRGSRSTLERATEASLALKGMASEEIARTSLFRHLISLPRERVLNQLLAASARTSSSSEDSTSSASTTFVFAREQKSTADLGKGALGIIPKLQPNTNNRLIFELVNMLSIPDINYSDRQHKFDDDNSITAEEVLSQTPDPRYLRPDVPVLPFQTYSAHSPERIAGDVLLNFFDCSAREKRLFDVNHPNVVLPARHESQVAAAFRLAVELSLRLREEARQMRLTVLPEAVVTGRKTSDLFYESGLARQWAEGSSEEAGREQWAARAGMGGSIPGYSRYNGRYHSESGMPNILIYPVLNKSLQEQDLPGHRPSRFYYAYDLYFYMVN